MGSKFSKTDAWVKVVGSRLTRLSLKDNTADVDRLLKDLEKALQDREVAIAFPLLKKTCTAK